MRPFIVFYLWLLAPLAFATAMLYTAVKQNAAKRETERGRQRQGTSSASSARMRERE